MSDSEFAKTHLKEYLASMLVSPIAEGFWSIMKSASEACERTGQQDQILRTFQNMLTKIPEWSDTTLSTEVERIEKVTKCTYLDDLLMGVFIAYMKSFASLQYRGESKEIKIDFDRPSLAKFIHELYINSARKLWQTAYLFKLSGTSSETQARNRQEVEDIIMGSLEKVIRSFLPWESISKKYFSEQLEGVTEEEEKAPEPQKSVVFEEEEEEDDEEQKAAISLGEEITNMKLTEDDVEEDPLKELESRATESLVLNL